MQAALSTKPIDDVLAGIRVHDVDTHVCEPRDLFAKRVSSQWGDLVRHVAVDPTDNKEHWFVDGRRSMQFAGGGGDDLEYDELTRLGAWEPEARLRWMDRNGFTHR